MFEPPKSLVPPELVPSGVRDDRQLALAQLFGEALAKLDFSALTMNDPMTVDVRLLPFMIREFGAQNYIDLEFPEHVQRRILKNIWELKRLNGYDAGVKLGLELLGMVPEITHWHELEPKGVPNTHTITFFIGEQLFENESVLFGPREIAAARRMVNATKRWSQDTSFVVGARLSAKPVRIAASLSHISFTRCAMRMVQHAPQLPLHTTIATNLSTVSVSRLRAA